MAILSDEKVASLTRRLVDTVIDYKKEAERLAIENETLRAALREIESITVHSGGDIHGVHSSFWEVAFKQAQDTARAALKEDGDA